MALSSFDRQILSDGLDHFSKPRLGAFLESLGDREEEWVEAVAAMLRNSSDDEIAHVVRLLDRAVTRIARERDRSERGGPGQDRIAQGSADRADDDEWRRRRRQSSAEWRATRRRSTT